MSKNSREKVYMYALRLHNPIIDLKDRRYCRMANEIIPYSKRRCRDCPLKSENRDHILCNYYDTEGDVETSSAEEKRRTDGLINAGIVREFPEFMDDGIFDCGGQIYEKALQFAADAHKGAFRKASKIPYIVHPVEVAEIVKGVLSEDKINLDKSDYEVIAAAALHDVVEDTPFTLGDIWENFNDRIEELVGYESEDKRPEIPAEDSWKIRKLEFLEHLHTAPKEAKLICLGDKLSNIRSLADDYREIGDECFQKFNNKNKKEQEWYYRGIAKELVCFEKSRAYWEYCSLFDEIFGKSQ